VLRRLREQAQQRRARLAATPASAPLRRAEPAGSHPAEPRTEARAVVVAVVVPKVVHEILVGGVVVEFPALHGASSRFASRYRKTYYDIS
jgi:hypothetical protein